MKSKILSLNVGGPAEMAWNGKSVVSSMLKTPIAGPLVVHRDHINGDSFANPQHHGTIDSVLYAMGVGSMTEYMRTLGRESYEPGSLGENVTLDAFDETQISVGDIFQFGDIVAQATFPRIPCAKVNFRMHHPDGQKEFMKCGRSGVYFRILTPGKIYLDSSVSRVEQAKVQIPISDVYAKVVKQHDFSGDEIEAMVANGAFPKRWLDRLIASS